MAKIAWFTGGLVLIWLTTIAVRSGFEISFMAAFALTVTFWCVAIGLQMAIGVRLSRTSEGERRFQISTIFLAMSYVGVYLAAIRAILVKLETENSNIPWYAWLWLAVLFLVGSVVISAFQLVFAEAMVSIGLKLQQCWHSYRR